MRRFQEGKCILVSPDFGSHGRHEEERQAPPLKSEAENRASYEEPEHMSEAEANVRMAVQSAARAAWKGIAGWILRGVLGKSK